MKKRILLITLLTLAISLTSFGGIFDIFKPKTKKQSIESSQTKNESTLVFANFRDIRDLNPHLYSGELYAQNMIFEGLIKIDTDGSFKPWLAKSWSVSEDGKTYIFQLRDDVYFSDGEKFNAESAKLNIEAVLSNINRHSWLESVRLMDAVKKQGGNPVEASSEYELTIRLAEPYYPLLVEFGVIRPFRFISPKSFINGTTKDGVNALNGTGAYVLSENHKDEYAIFETNPNYWGEKPSIKKVIVKVIADNQARVMALENGEIDMIFGTNLVDAETYNKFKTINGFDAVMSEPLSTRMLLLNTNDSIVGELNVRKALQHAINKEIISNAIFEGIESPADFLFDPSVPYANIGLKAYNFDMTEAERLLDEAGWLKVNGKKVREKNGKELAVTLNYNSNNHIDKTISEFIQGEVSKIGINLSIVGEEEQANRDRMKAGDFQIIFNISWGNPYDPHSFLGATTAPGVYGDYYAQQGIKDKKEIDKAVIHALESIDEKKRQEYYKYVMTRLHEEAVYLPLTNERNRAVFNNKLESPAFEVSKYEIPVYKLKIK